MVERQPKFHEWFHKFMIYFAMWAFPLVGVIEGIRYIHFAVENSVSNKVIIIILSVLLMLASLFCIKARFDLAAFKRIAIKEIRWVCLTAAATVFLINFLMEQNGDIDDLHRAWGGLIVAVWGIAVYRYYNERAYVFKD